MVKKLFVLASVTALTGLLATTGVAGCSSTTTVTDNGDSGGTSGGDSGGPKTPVDSGGGDDTDAAPQPTTCPDSTPVTAADIEMQLKWMPPSAIQSVCTQTNLDDLKALFVKGGGSAKFTDMQTTLGATCAACAFTKDTATNWGPLVQSTNGFINNTDGNCLGQLEGSACGKAIFEADICLDAVCPQDTCTDQQTCVQKAVAGPCKALGTAANSACPNLSADGDICGGIVDAIAISCGGGVDGGLDSSVQ